MALAGFAVAPLLAAVALTGCAPGRVVAGEPPAPVTASAPAPTTSVPGPPRGPAPLPPVAQIKVSSLTIASIGLKTTRLEQLALESDGALAAPEDPDRAGWYAGGTVPGEIGPAVIAGHVDSRTGPAVFFELGKVDRGDEVTVALSNGTTTTYRVDRVVTTPKKGFPTDEVFGPTPDAQLRLITCGGPYNRTARSYADNTVVFATAEP